MANFTNIIRSTCALALCSGLWACDTLSSLDVTSVVDVFSEAPPPPCPSVNILAKSETITIFRANTGQDIIDIETEAKIDDFAADCLYNVDEETGIGTVDVNLSLGVTAARGAANDEGQATLPYFVTITDLNKNILTKSIFKMPLAFDGNNYRLSVYDTPVTMTIPIQPPNDGDDFLIYIGFQLTKKQLRYNEFLRESSGG